MNEKRAIKKVLFLIITLLFLIPNTSFAERWQTIKNEKYGVSMQAPITWNTLTTALERPDGSFVLLGLFSNDTYVWLSYHPAYIAANSYADYTETERDFTATLAVNDFKKAEPGSELVWKRFVNQNDRISLELVFKVYKDGKELRSFMQIFIKDHHLYAISILFRPDQDTFSALPIITNSIKFE